MVVQTIAIECLAHKALDFMSDAPQWLPWALPAVESVQPLPFGQWLVKTAGGLAKLRPAYDPARGCVNYELVYPNARRWQVPVRVVPTATGCQFAATFVKPKALPLEAFEAGMRHTAEGLHTLKLVLEQD